MFNISFFFKIVFIYFSVNHPGFHLLVYQIREVSEKPVLATRYCKRKNKYFTKTSNSFKALYNNSTLYEYKTNCAEQASKHYSGGSRASSVKTEPKARSSLPNLIWCRSPTGPTGKPETELRI